MTQNTSDTTASNDTQASTSDSLRDKAGELRDKAGGLLQDGIDLVKNNPGAAAAVIGGVAATAAAAVYRDKIAAVVKGDGSKDSNQTKKSTKA